LGRESGRTNCLSHRFRVDRGPREELERFIDSMIERKRRGEKIHTSEAILNHQRSLLRGEHVEWTCMAGYKLFFVSAQGKFLICSMVHTDKQIMDVTLDDLYANYRKKIVPERLSCLLRSECFASRGKACSGSGEGNRLRVPNAFRQCFVVP
jgi:hypothetical protein